MSGFDINQLTISGNLTRDPELRYLTNATAVCSIRIAHNERRKTSAGEWTDHPQYFDVTVWSGLGEWVARNVAKGQKVVVAGRLKWREYDVDDQRHQAVDITADSIVPVPARHSDPEPTADEVESGRDDLTPPTRTSPSDTPCGPVRTGRAATLPPARRRIKRVYLVRGDRSSLAPCALRRTGRFRRLCWPVGTDERRRSQANPHS